MSPNVEYTSEINGVDVFYRAVGHHPRNVLLVHGHPFNYTMWRPQTEYLRDNYRVVVPDLRGYGKTPLPDDSRETRLETFAADNLALMDSLGIREFVLGGLSMGGQIALEIYRQAPARIQALLLADTFAGLDSAERRQWRFTTADRLEREGMEATPRKSSPR
jgi:pimeloyl-ACP methyl ester carboxylesterase